MAEIKKSIDTNNPKHTFVIGILVGLHLQRYRGYKSAYLKRMRDERNTEVEVVKNG